MESPYEILKDLCKVRDQPSHLIYGLPVFTNRMRFIIQTLSKFSAPFTIDSFKYDHSHFKNIYVMINGLEKRNTLYFLAHHDVLENSFENANDNSGSISILLSLIERYTYIENLNFNLVFVFTDNEEMGFSGAKRFVEQLHSGYFRDTDPIHIINLELCGVGNNLWIENAPDANLLYDGITYYHVDKKYIINCPTNDANFIRDEFPYYQNATTIGLLPSNGDGDLDKSVWNNIHTAGDKIQNLNSFDMMSLVMALNNYIIDVNEKMKDE